MRRRLIPTKFKLCKKIPADNLTFSSFIFSALESWGLVNSKIKV